MKVKNMNWKWVTKEKDIQQVTRNLDRIRMFITERFGKYRLKIWHSYKYAGNTYYDLKSKDMESACNEADDIAREEFTRLVEWNTKLINELGDN